MAQIVRCLPSKCQALSSNPSTAEREREREREREMGVGRQEKRERHCHVGFRCAYVRQKIGRR
jgi:hypothetical protein